MPTPYRRIAVVADPSLTEALETVEPYFEGMPKASIVHRLALEGAAAIVRERAAEEAAIEELVELSTKRDDSINWDLLEHVDDAWGT